MTQVISFAWMQALNRYPLTEIELPSALALENPAKDYHPALDIAYADVNKLVWIVPFVLQKGHELIMPLWIPAKLEQGRLSVSPQHLAPWVPSILTQNNASVSPWAGCFNQFGHIIELLVSEWRSQTPEWGTFYHRLIRMLEECAKTPWHYFFSRNGWEKAPSRLYFADQFCEHPILHPSHSEYNPTEWSLDNRPGLSGGAIDFKDCEHIARIVSASNCTYAIHSSCEQANAFIPHLCAAFWVNESRHEKRGDIVLYSHEPLANIVAEPTDKSFAKLLEAYAEGVTLFNNGTKVTEPDNDFLLELKKKIKLCQSKDATIEQELKHWQTVYKQCEAQIPHKWSEKLKFVHSKRDKVRDELIHKLSNQANIVHKVQYATLPDRIRELKVKRHKIHKQIMLLAQEQCSQEATQKKFIQWCAKHQLPYSKESAFSLEAKLNIWYGFARSLFSASMIEKFSEPSLDTTVENFYTLVQNNNQLEWRQGISKGDIALCIVPSAHRQSVQSLHELQSRAERVVLLGNYFANDYLPARCDDEQGNALKSLLQDEELPQKCLLDTMPKLHSLSTQASKLQELIACLQQHQAPSDDFSAVLSILQVVGQSNISDEHYCNIPQVQAIKALGELQDTIVVTPFYEQKCLLQTTIPECKVYTLNELPDTCFDKVIFSAVYSQNDPRPYVFDEGSEFFLNLLQHVKQHLLIVTDTGVFNPQYRSVSGLLAKALALDEAKAV